MCWGPGKKNRQISGWESFTGTHKAKELTFLRLEHSKTHPLLPDPTLPVCTTRFPPPPCSHSSDPGRPPRHPRPCASGPTGPTRDPVQHIPVPPRRAGTRVLDAPLLDCASAHAACACRTPQGTGVWGPTVGQAPGHHKPHGLSLGNVSPPLANLQTREGSRRTPSSSLCCRLAHVHVPAALLPWAVNPSFTGGGHLGRCPWGVYTRSQTRGCADDVRVEARGPRQGRVRRALRMPPLSPQWLQTARPAGDTPGKVQFTIAHGGDCPQVMCCVTERRP